MDRFAAWIETQTEIRWDILFTPWGEALVRSWYRRAVARLTRLPHVDRVAVQTNLSCGLDWMKDCRTSRLALWATFHPTEIGCDTFCRKVVAVFEQGIGISAGVVAVPEHFEHIAALRRGLPPEVYMWINAQQPRSRPYTDDEVGWLASIDPHFRSTLRREPSRNRFCRAGRESFTVDSSGDMRRCHFVADVIGNIFESEWHKALLPRRCPNRFCDCLLGKSQFDAQSKQAFLERFEPSARYRLDIPSARSQVVADREDQG